MKWLLLSSATEIKVLNFSNHRQADPAGKHTACCELGWSGQSGCPGVWARACAPVRVLLHCCRAPVPLGLHLAVVSHGGLV